MAQRPHTRPRVGLVLGAGGAAGLAFHAGVLWALHHDLGWDPRTADVIVGTSAGSIVGALLRSGVSPEDLAAWATDADPSAEGGAFRATMEVVDGVITRRSVPRLATPGWHALSALRHPSQLPGAMASMLPHGLHDHSARVKALDHLLDTWPSEALWISAVRVGDGRLHWFGRDPVRTDQVELADAVAASCAVPVLARPVLIGGHRYVDGGVKSSTHADVLRGADLDLVVVSSPMGHQAGRNPLRSLAHRRTRYEVARLEQSGVITQLISPDAATVDSMGINMMERSRVGSVMRHSFLGTTSQLDVSVAGLLGGTRLVPPVRARDAV